MPQQRETATDRLSNVIQVIQLGRKSGVLTVERDDGITTEEGSITFVNGQATQASAGNRVNIDAFNWLNAWGTCRFAFLPSSTEQQTVPLPALPRFGAPTNSASDTQPLHALPIGRQGVRSNRYYPVRGTSIPFRTRQIEEALRLIEHLGLSRSHRRLLLLIDGQRTVAELARLMGREQDELQKLFSALEKAGVIQQ